MLWLQPCAFQCSQKRCGSSHARFNVLRSAVAAAMRVSMFSEALWLQPCAFQCFENCCGCSHGLSKCQRNAVAAAMRVAVRGQAIRRYDIESPPRRNPMSFNDYTQAFYPPAQEQSLVASTFRRSVHLTLFRWIFVSQSGDKAIASCSVELSQLDPPQS